jgi:hypothetical protein
LTKEAVLEHSEDPVELERMMIQFGSNIAKAGR